MNEDTNAVKPDRLGVPVGRFRKVQAVVWRRLDNQWDGYIVLKLGRFYRVLCEDDGFWSQEGSFDTENEARAFVLEQQTLVLKKSNLHEDYSYRRGGTP